MAIPDLLTRPLRYRLFRQRWNIAVIPHPVAAVAGLEGAARQAQALADAVWMAEDPGAFRADPFLAPHPAAPGEHLVFYEDFPWDTAQGTIGACRWDGARFGEPVAALATGHHLSYPYVTELGGRPVIVPEHSAARDVSAYAFDASGRAGERTGLIAGLPLIDPTIVHHGGRWWLFATRADEGDNLSLNLFHAERPEGPWTAHAGNPVKRDPGSARPAGQPFTFRGELYRPAQDCRRYYGEAVVINRIVELSEEAFVEEAVSEVRPPAGWRYRGGLHTLAHCGETCVIDAARFESLVHPALDRLSGWFA